MDLTIFDLYNVGAIGMEAVGVWSCIFGMGWIRRSARQDVCSTSGQEVKH